MEVAPKLSKAALLQWAAGQREKFTLTPRLPHRLPDLSTPEKQAAFRERCEAAASYFRSRSKLGEVAA